jgi:hypothetical protein
VISSIRRNKTVGRLCGILTVALVISSSAMVLSQSKPVRVPGAQAEKLLIQPQAMPLRPAIRGTGFPAHLEFTVTPAGSVIDIVDLDHHPTNPANGQPTDAMGVSTYKAMQAVALWKFHPYLRDGLPAAMRVTVEFKYENEWKTNFK